jgi:hypothetical protein
MLCTDFWKDVCISPNFTFHYTTLQANQDFCVLALFFSAFCTSDYVAQNGKMISEQWAKNDVERSRLPGYTIIPFLTVLRNPILHKSKSLL